MKSSENNHEIERRFAPKQIPEAILLGVARGEYRKLEIHQGYVPDERGTRLRDECENGVHQYFVTWKEREGLQRIENEHEIHVSRFKEDFRNILCELWKIRYLIPHGNHVVELNFFLGKLEGYIQIEVEFETVAEALAFVVPCWFGREVTDAKEHGNFFLARDGAPKQ